MTKLALDAAFTPTSRTMTPEGYLCVKGIAARTGVYQYLSSELDLEGPERMVGVYRSPESVFSPDSMATYADKDVTNDHPSDLVNSETFRSHSVGHVRSAAQDGENIVVDMIIKDQSAIDDINAGKAELSPGYLAEYVPVNGVDPYGTPYEFEQRDIVINHVAVVEAARAGKQARIFDQKPKGATMTRKVVLDSKRNLSVTLDDDIAGVVESAISTKDAEVNDVLGKLAAANQTIASKDAESDKLREENEELKKETSDSAIASRIAAVVKTTDAARKIVKGFDAKGSTSLLEIKRACMLAKFPTRDWAAKSESYVEAAFDAEAEKETTDSDDEDGDKGMTKDAKATLDGIARDAAAFKDARGKMAGTTAYNDFLKGKK